MRWPARADSTFPSAVPSLLDERSAYINGCGLLDWKRRRAAWFGFRRTFRHAQSVISEILAGLTTANAAMSSLSIAPNSREFDDIAAFTRVEQDNGGTAKAPLLSAGASLTYRNRGIRRVAEG